MLHEPIPECAHAAGQASSVRRAGSRAAGPPGARARLEHALQRIDGLQLARHRLRVGRLQLGGPGRVLLLLRHDARLHLFPQLRRARGASQPPRAAERSRTGRAACALPHMEAPQFSSTCKARHQRMGLFCTPSRQAQRLRGPALLS